MGLIKDTLSKLGNAAKDVGNNATGGLLGGVTGVLNQAMFQEYFVSGSMADDVIMKRAEQVKTNGSTNTKSDANIISNGSVIDVHDNQCMIIVENGKVVEACMEPGRFTYDTSVAPSFFAGEGSFGEKAKNVALEMWEQAKVGGQRRNTQRIYFINMGVLDKSLTWGAGNIQFQHTETFVGGGAPFAIGVTLKGHGTARVRIERPLDFYVNYGVKFAGGDNNAAVTIDSLETFFTASKNRVTEAIAMAITELGNNKAVRYNQIMTVDNMKELRDLVNAQMEDTDLARIGFDFYEFTVGGSGFILNDEDRKRITDIQTRAFESSNINLANYTIQSKMAEGFQKAGENGGVTGIMGMGMAMGGGIGNLGNMQAQPVPQYNQPQSQPVVAAVTTNADTWTCECGTVATGNFCPNCGTKKVEKVAVTADNAWVCSCGNTNEGNFCANCGSKKPEAPKKLVCDKCGWTSEDLTIKFCPNCGDKVEEVDFK